MQQIRITILFLTLLALTVGTGYAQNAKGVWTLGFHGGANVWISDYSEHMTGEGGEIMLRYGITDWFSAGVVGGYEELRANQSPISTYPWLTNSYLKLHAIPLAMVGYIHLAP